VTAGGSPVGRMTAEHGKLRAEIVKLSVEC